MTKAIPCLLTFGEQRFNDVSPVIGIYVTRLDPNLPDEQARQLLSYLPRMAGSYSAEHESARAEILARNVVLVLTPLVLDAVGLPVEAKRLRGLSADYSPMKVADVVVEAEAAALRKAEVKAKDVANAAWEALLAVWGTKNLAADATWSAIWAARAAIVAAEVVGPAAWDAALAMLDEALSAGPQGEP